MKRQQVGLLEAMQALADSTHNARCIHAMRVVKGYGKSPRNRSDVEDFVRWMQAKPLANRTIAGIL